MTTTTIQVESRTRDQLRNLGRKGETYDEVIGRLIKQAQYAAFMEDQYAILKGDRRWVPLDDL